MTAIMIYMTASSREEASTIAKDLVEKRLVACANIFEPHSSVYWWEDKVEQAEEVAVIFKTWEELFEKVKEAILELHSYDCPCIVTLPVQQGYEPFLQWIEKETNI